jgi:hypothetical protein
MSLAAYGLSPKNRCHDFAGVSPCTVVVHTEPYRER